MGKEKINAIIYTLSDFLSKGIPFLILPLVTFYLSPAEFGQLNIYLVYSEIMLIIIMMGGNTYLRVSYFKKKENVSNIIYNGLFISLLIMIISVMLIKIFIHDLNENLLIILNVSSFIQCIIIYNTTLYQCEQKAKNVAIVNFLTTLSSNISFVFLLYLDYGYEAKIISIFISVMLVVSYIYISKDRLKLNNVFLSLTEVKKITSFGLGILPHAISWWARPAIDRILINNYSTIESVGIYSLSFQLSIPIFILTNALNQAFNPKIYYLLNKGEFSEAKRISVIIIIAITIIAFIYSSILYYTFDMFYNQQYSGAKEFSCILILVLSLQSVIILFSNFLYFFNEQLLLSKITFFSCVIHVFITFMLVDFLSYEYIYISYLFSFFITIILIVNRLNKEKKIESL